MNPVATQLQAAPRVFSLQIAWQTNHETPADIAATLSAVDEEVGGGEGHQGGAASTAGSVSAVPAVPAVPAL
jgi:hypothetical protein